MNPRLKELAAVARKYAIDQYSNNPHHDEIQGLFSAEVFQQKFAELNIKECAVVVMGYENHHGKILEHFGIK